MKDFADKQERKQIDTKLEKLASIVNKANEKLGVDCKCNVLPEDKYAGICVMNPAKHDLATTKAVSDVFDKILKEEDYYGLHPEAVSVGGPYAGWYVVSQNSFIDLTIENFEKNYEPMLNTELQANNARVANLRKNDGR